MFSFLRQLSQSLNKLPGPEVPAGAWEEILARRERGERVILPAVDPPLPVHSSRQRYLMIAASVLLLVIGGLVVLTSAPEAEALKSELRFLPAGPRQGARVDVEYRPDPALAGEETVTLRARYRTPLSDEYNRTPMQVTVGALVRDADGTFRGSFQLPDSVVYAVFAVEDLDGSRVDHNHRRLWELLVREPDGRPQYEALIQKETDLIGRNWELALETVREMTLLYPDRPDGWSRLMSLERQVLGEAAAESLMVEHRARFQTLHREMKGRPHLAAEEALGMRSYAVRAGGAEEKRYWNERFKREFPGHPRVIQERTTDLWNTYSAEPDGVARYFSELDALWGSARQDIPTYDRIILNALADAEQANDSAAFLRWAKRYRSTGGVAPERMQYVASLMDRWPGLRNEKMRWLREALQMLEAMPNSFRTLENSLGQQRQENREDAVRILADLGETLVAAGDTAAGMDTLKVAASRGWSPKVFRTLAAVQLALGDTAAALQNLARVAADPLSHASFADSARLIGGHHFVPTEWQSWVASGGLEMAEQILAGTIRSPLDTELSLEDEEGRVRTLEKLRGRDATVVLFWSRWCGPAVRAVPVIERLNSWLLEHGVPLITVVVEERSDELHEVLKERFVSVPIYYDYKLEVTTALYGFSTPEYYVLDGSGWLAFTGSGLLALERIPQEVTALLTQP